MFENLLKPIKIGPHEIKNRIAMAPCNLHFSDGEGLITEQWIMYYSSRAKGGIGLTIVGAVMANKEDAEAASLVIPRLDDVWHIPPFQEIVEIVHEHDSKCFIQLVPGLGRQSRLPKRPIMVPSIVPMEKIPDMQVKALQQVQDRFFPFKIGAGYGNYKEMTIDDIQKVQDNFAKSCRYAIYAGFDGIELHFPHGYLGHSFLSPRTNLRKDQYGGSFENRFRFLKELIGKVRAEIGKRCALGVRISANEHMAGGLTPEDFKAIAKECEKEGLDYIHLSDGCFEAFKYFFPEHENDHILDEAKIIKQGLNIPIITPSVHDPVHAEEAIKAGKTDMISLGRQLFADPEWANKVKEGRPQDIVRCKRDYVCLLWLYTEGRIRCSVNPNLGRERYMQEYWPKKKSSAFPHSLMAKE